MCPRAQKGRHLFQIIRSPYNNMKLSPLRPKNSHRVFIRQSIVLLLAAQILTANVFANVSAKGSDVNGRRLRPNTSNAKRAAAPFARATPAAVEDNGFKIDSTQVTAGGNGKLKIEFTTCPAAASDRFNITDGNKLIDNRDDLLKQGITLNVSAADSKDCALIVEYRVAPNPSVTTWAIVLKRKADATEKVTIDMVVVGIAPIPRKPIPEGMQPEVDIMWRVVPQRIVKDNYGTRVGKFFYCIEVIIGNNTGFDLQIVTVGFEVGPVGQQTKQMAEFLNKSYAENDATSDQLLKTAQTQGKAAVDAATAARDKALYEFRVAMLVLEKNPKATDDEKRKLCDADGECKKLKKDWEESQKKSNASDELAAIDKKYADDLVKSRRFTVDALKAKRDELAQISQLIYQNKIPGTSYRMARGSLEHGQFWSFRNVSINMLKAFGPFLTGFTPYFHNINRQSHYSEAINIISNPLEKGFEAVVPDETVAQMQRLDEQVLRDGMIIQNNRQVVTHAFIPKDNLGLVKELKKYRDDPLMVTLALGKLHIVGDKIQFINRVSVTSGGSGEVRPRPTVSGNTAAELKLGDTAKEMILTGRFLEDAQLISDDPEIKITKKSNTEGSFTAAVDVGEKAERRPHNFTLTTDGGERLVRVTVAQPLPKLDKPSEPEFVGDKKEPKALLTKEERYTIKVTGQFLEGASLSPKDAASKLRAENIKVASDFKSFTADIVVPENTPANPPDKPYQFRVGNAEHDQTDAALPLLDFTIKDRGKPVAESPLKYGEDGAGNPPSKDGKDKEVTILVKGSNLTGATLSIKDLAGEPVILKDKSDDTRLVARVPVAADAAVKDYEVTVKLGDKKAENVPTFRIEPPQATVNPPVLVDIEAGKSADVTLTGTFTKEAKVPKKTAEGFTVELKTADPRVDNKLVVTITAPAAFTGPASVTFDVINSSNKIDATKPTPVTVPVKPKPAS